MQPWRGIDRLEFGEAGKPFIDRRAKPGECFRECVDRTMPLKLGIRGSYDLYKFNKLSIISQ
jgi:hypothetical protein